MIVASHLGVSRYFVSLVCAAAFCAACAADGVGDAREAACQIVESGELLLLGDTSVTFDPPLSVLAVDSRSNYYAGVGGVGGQVMYWSSDGILRGLLGQPGEGPGELAPGTVVPLVGPGDTLFVRDNRGRWNLFDPQGTFVTNAPLGPIQGGASLTTLLTSDGEVVSTRSRSGFGLQVVRRDGTVRHALLPGDPVRLARTARAVALGPQQTYWVGPEYGPSDGYLLSRLDSTGNVVQEIRREVSWFPPRPTYDPMPRSGAPQQFPYPTVAQIVVDRDELLWVTTVVPASKDSEQRYQDQMGRQGPDVAFTDSLQELRRRLRAELLRVRIEVFSPDGELLASRQVPYGSQSLVQQIPGQNRWYSIPSGEGDDSVLFRVFSLAVEGRGGGRCQ